MVQVMETDRLILREMEEDDAEFVLELLNEPGWLEHIGDRGVHSQEDARAYIRGKLRVSYAENGFGFYAVLLRGSNTPAGICGIVKRPSLDDVDLGFAFLERHCGQGLAREASEEVIRFAREELALDRLVAITSPQNTASVRLLTRLGMEYEGLVRLEGEGEDLKLFGLRL